MADIFDKIVGGINKGVATVGTGSKAMVEKARIKTVIKNLETEKTRLASLLGMKIYEEHTRSGEKITDESTANFISEIDIRLEKIAEQQAELRRIDEELNMATSISESTPSEGRAFCVCGNVMPLEAKFCTKCGSAI